jgi:hypothetical protein
MKNIFLIETDKPSRLRLDDGELVLGNSKLCQNTLNYQYQNIYITNSEQIRLNDYITDGYSVWKWKDDSSLLGRKKVILTTDTTLIADGVQSIDDTFLEWFVKNTSCEYVKTDLVPVNEFGSEITVKSYGFDKFKYKIIIPKEEPKQERMYSEGDMKKAIKFGLDGLYGYQMGEDGYFDNQVKRFLKEIK